MNTTRLKKLNDGSFVTMAPIVTINKGDLAFLHQISQHLPQQRARICTHRDNEVAIHEMIISLQQGSYVHPHCHLNKTESFHIIQGRCDVLLFKKDGTLSDIIQLGEYASGLPFFYRLADPLFHTLLIHSPIVTLHETTNGPFNKEETMLAPWAPQESDMLTVQSYLKELTKKAETFLKNNHS